MSVMSAGRGEGRTPMIIRSRRVKGQSLIEYAVLVSAVTFGAMLAANVAYRAFAGHAQEIERNELVF